MHGIQNELRIITRLENAMNSKHLGAISQRYNRPQSESQIPISQSRVSLRVLFFSDQAFALQDNLAENMAGNLRQHPTLIFRTKIA